MRYQNQSESLSRLKLDRVAVLDGYSGDYFEVEDVESPRCSRQGAKIESEQKRLLTDCRLPKPLPKLLIPGR